MWHLASTHASPCSQSQAAAAVWAHAQVARLTSTFWLRTPTLISYRNQAAAAASLTLASSDCSSLK